MILERYFSNAWAVFGLKLGAILIFFLTAPLVIGYIEHKVFVAEDGERVTVVTFADQATHDAWRTHPEHRAAQKAGRDGYYRQYSIAVGTVERAGAWTRPADR